MSLADALARWIGKQSVESPIQLALISPEHTNTAASDSVATDQIASDCGSASTIEHGGSVDIRVTAKLTGGEDLQATMRLQCPAASDLKSGEGMFMAESIVIGDDSVPNSHSSSRKRSRGDSEAVVERFTERAVEMNFSSVNDAFEGIIAASHALWHNQLAKSSDATSLRRSRSLLASSAGLTSSWGSASFASSLAEDSASFDVDPDDIDDALLVGGDADFSERFPKWFERLEVSVAAANAQLGAQLVRLRRDTGFVTVTVPVADVLSDSLAQALDVIRQAPLIISLDYCPRGRFIDAESTQKSSLLPMPLPSVAQPWNTQQDRLKRGSVVRAAVETFVSSNWDKMVVNIEADHVDDRVEFLRTPSGTVSADAVKSVQAEDRFKTMAAEHPQQFAQMYGAKPTPKPSKPPKKKKARLQSLEKEFMDGYRPGDTTQLNASEKEQLDQLGSMGFEEETSAFVLHATGGKLETAVEQLLSGTFEIDPLLQQIASMGFSIGQGRSALAQADKVNDVDAAIALLLSDAEVESIDNTTRSEEERTGRKGRQPGSERLPLLYEGALPESFAEESDKALSAGIGRAGQYGFFAALVIALRERLRHYTRYCVVCGHCHCCNSNSDKPVVCNQPLCMFRYEELGMGVKESNIYLCPFQVCPERYDPNDSIMKTLAGGTDATKEMDLATLERMYNSKYSFPKYLPHSSVMEFVREGKLAHVTPIKKITQVMKPEHVFRFEAKWKAMRALRGDSVRPFMAYHGTAAANVANIVDKGLLVPGKTTGVKHATDEGFWGRGVYLSPNAQLSLGYCRAGSKLLLCSVLMGKTFKCTQMMTGGALKSGHDSHEDPSGNEWVIFDPAQILVCYVVDFGK